MSEDSISGSKTEKIARWSIFSSIELDADKKVCLINSWLRRQKPFEQSGANLFGDRLRGRQLQIFRSGRGLIQTHDPSSFDRTFDRLTIFIAFIKPSRDGLDLTVDHGSISVTIKLGSR